VQGITLSLAINQTWAKLWQRLCKAKIKKHYKCAGLLLALTGWYATPWPRGNLALWSSGGIITGDYNTAHNEIDLKNPKANQDRSGFLRIERDWLDSIVSQGYVDTFRYLYPETVKYSWWTYRFKARERNAGWRIDYFFVTQDLIDNNRVKEAFIENDIFGSDHCPVGLVLDFS